MRVMPIRGQAGQVGRASVNRDEILAVSWRTLVRALHHLFLFKFLVGSFAESKSPILP